MRTRRRCPTRFDWAQETLSSRLDKDLLIATCEPQGDTAGTVSLLQLAAMPARQSNQYHTTAATMTILPPDLFDSGDAPTTAYVIAGPTLVMAPKAAAKLFKGGATVALVGRNEMHEVRERTPATPVVDSLRQPGTRNSSSL